MTEDQIGNAVAKEVWAWLQEQKAIKYMPWVLEPKSERFDYTKAAVQKERDMLLSDLERVILDFSSREVSAVSAHEICRDLKNNKTEVDKTKPQSKNLSTT